MQLAPLVLAAAADDAVAAAIVDRLAAEVVALARAVTRLDLTDEAVEVLLGGGFSSPGTRGCSTGSRRVCARSVRFVIRSSSR